MAQVKHSQGFGSSSPQAIRGLPQSIRSLPQPIRGLPQPIRGLPLLKRALTVLLLALCVAPAFGQTLPGNDEIIEGLKRSEFELLKQRAQAEENVQRAQTPAEQNRQFLDVFPTGASAGGQTLNLTSSDFIYIDTESNLIYGRPRSVIRYGNYELHADYIIVDRRLMEVQAEGEVSLIINNQELKAEKLIFNFLRQEGVIFNASGRESFFNFQAGAAGGGGPILHQLSSNEAYFTNTNFTSCDFPYPHYYIRAGEVTVFSQDRIFMRNAIVYIRDIPVAYLPAFTRSLKENQPWHFAFGRESNRLGEYILGVYSYDYGDQVPEPESQSVFWDMVGPTQEQAAQTIPRNRGSVKYYFDYFTKRGLGLGLKHSYSLDYNRHKGLWDLYGIYDRDYDVANIERDTRWAARLGHRSRLNDRWWWHTQIDYLSDPEIYYDIIDRKSSQAPQRRRVAERQAESALTYLREQMLVRALFGVKERVSRDRVTNFSNYRDDDRDFDEVANDEGLHPDRYGLVSARLPQITASSSWLSLLQSRLFYHFDLNLLNNLDKGLNVNSTEDDAFVRGFDLYQQLMFYWRFGPRTNLIAKLGGGGGQLEREVDEFNLNFPTGNKPLAVKQDGDYTSTGPGDPARTAFPGTPYGNELIFFDEETFLIGDELMRLSDYQKSFAYGDVDVQLNQRFSRSLQGAIRYFLRNGTDNSLSEWYAAIGNRLARDDLYNYRLRQNFIEAALNYTLQQPRFRAFLTARENLESIDDIYDSERLRTASAGWQYQTPERVWGVRQSIGYQRLQIRPPGHIYEYERDYLSGAVDLTVTPKHKNWEGALRFYLNKTLDDDPNPAVDNRDDDDYFDETDTRYGLRGELFTFLGPKWAVRFSGSYEFKRKDLKRFTVHLMRDIHDAVLNFEIRIDDDHFKYRRDNRRGRDRSINFKFYLTFKLPTQDLTGAQPLQSILKTNQRIEEDG